MSSIANSSSADRRHRSNRVAPRRHVENSEEVGAGTYDSNEFPVLLRMPDVSRPAGLGATRDGTLAGTGASQAATRESKRSQETASSTKRPPQPERTKSASEKAPSVAASERRLSSASAIRFWSTIPPQAAAGGMLLAVIVLCFALLRDSNSSVPPLDTMSDWSSGTPQASQDAATEAPPAAQSTVTPTFTADGQAGHESVAAKPAARITPKLLGEPTPAQPGLPAPAVSDWPTSASTKTWPTAAAEEDVTPIQAWPDNPGGTAGSDGTLLNAPSGSAEGQTSLTLRTSQRSARPAEATMAPSRVTTDSYPLDGTIEIPPPTKINQQ